MALMLPLDSIQVAENRQRREFDAGYLRELASSIAERGLFHAVGVIADGSGWKLVHGERRLRAIRDLRFMGKTLRYAGSDVEAPLIPCINMGALDPLAAEESEYDENAKRKDLTWQEDAAATARLADLRRRRAEADGKERPTTAAIAQERRGSSEGIHHENTRRELIVAQHLDDPEVKSAKSLDEAYKTLKRREAAAQSAALAETIGRTFTAALHEARNEDCYEWMAHAPGEQFDVILTDPPYGMGADEFGDSGGRAVGAHGYADTPELWTQVCSVLPLHAYRIAKPQAHFYAFCDFDGFHELRSAMGAAGWWVHRTPLIWHKPSASRVPWPEHGPQRKYEIVLYAIKGKKPVTRIFPDLFSYNADDNLGHGAQKPVAAYVDLLKRSVQPGNRVFDPFAGTGTIFPAAHELKCVAVGIEKDPSAYGICLKRLEALRAQGELPV